MKTFSKDIALAVDCAVLCRDYGFNPTDLGRLISYKRKYTRANVHQSNTGQEPRTNHTAKINILCRSMGITWQANGLVPSFYDDRNRMIYIPD